MDLPAHCGVADERKEGTIHSRTAMLPPLPVGRTGIAMA
ncbi:MAG: hypothetical protein KatS3mg004_0164 [Bryobacteraceae bacterium]|nr:MAG: hypothetical protein KatS3mg004_0164 [Bryobacteraceae bacterium]